MPVAISDRVALTALPDLPMVAPGDSLADIIWNGLRAAHIELAAGDVLVMASKLASRAENRYVDLNTVTPSSAARALAQRVEGDERLVELILRESLDVSRASPHALIVRHKLGFVSANAGIDSSNSRPLGAAPDSGPWVLLLPENPDATARALQIELEARAQLAEGAHLGVIVSDSFGRPFRLGTVGTALGVAGVPAVNDMRGAPDLDERVLQHTVTALADQIAAAADLVAGQGAEGRGVVHVRGVVWDPESARLWGQQDGQSLLRPVEGDLYA